MTAANKPEPTKDAAGEPIESMPATEKTEQTEQSDKSDKKPDLRPPLKPPAIPACQNIVYRMNSRTLLKCLLR